MTAPQRRFGDGDLGSSQPPAVTPPARTERRWTGWIFLAALSAAVLVWAVTRLVPPAPPGAVPASSTERLAAEHGCRPPQEWPAGQPAAGALVATVDPGREPRVAWVPAGDGTRWQPGWWLRQWCER